MDLKDPEVDPTHSRKGVGREGTRGERIEGEDRFVRFSGGRALEARKLKRAKAPDPD